jgi:hypothetical protein
MSRGSRSASWFLPCQPVYAGYSVPFQLKEREPKETGADVLEERVNRSFFLSLAACRKHPALTTRFSRFCARGVVCWPTFRLAPALRSIGSAANCSALFTDFPATTAESDFAHQCVIGLADADQATSLRQATVFLPTNIAFATMGGIAFCGFFCFNFLTVDQGDDWSAAFIDDINSIAAFVVVNRHRHHIAYFPGHRGISPFIERTTRIGIV